MPLLYNAAIFPLHSSPPSSSSSRPSTTVVVRAAVSAPEKKQRKRRQKKNQLQSLNEHSNVISAAEKSLRLAFMEELMERARNKDADGVSDVLYDMIAAGLSPGPRSYHGLVIANVLNRDEEGTMQSLRRELSAGLHPLHETLMALVRLFGSKGHAIKGLEILAGMEKLNYDIRQAWIVLVEELLRNDHFEDANNVFLKGAKGGLRATDELYDLIIEQDCKVGDHSNAIDIVYEWKQLGGWQLLFILIVFSVYRLLVGYLK